MRPPRLPGSPTLPSPPRLYAALSALASAVACLPASFGALAARLLPGCCGLCGCDAASPLCADCRRYAADPAPRCAVCADVLTMVATRCGRCSASPPAFDASIVATRYAAPLDLLVQALKFRAQLPLAPVFAQLLADATAQQSHNPGDLLIAVPLAARGFNQAHEIARPLARALQLPLLTDACVRVRATLPQSGLTLAQRRDNMRGAFAVINPRAIAGHRVLVVDDVMTTGHTLDALARCLKRHGAARVTNLVFARTPRQP